MVKRVPFTLTWTNASSSLTPAWDIFLPFPFLFLLLPLFGYLTDLKKKFSFFH